jgi:hypothetical protein
MIDTNPERNAIPPLSPAAHCSAPHSAADLFRLHAQLLQTDPQQLRSCFRVTIHARTDAPFNKGPQAMGRFFGCLLFSIFLCGSPIYAQTDLAVSVFGAFNQSTSGSVITQSPSNQAGILIEARHIRNPLVGYEVTYAYNRANQAYTNPPPSSCPASGCGFPSYAAIQANTNELTADWVVSMKVLGIRPFALAGGGALITIPTGGTLTTTTWEPPVCGIPCEGVTTTTNTPASTQSQSTINFVYGAGVDWPVLPHLGLRFQYRGRVYTAPALATAFSSTNSFTRTSEPVSGAFFRF